MIGKFAPGGAWWRFTPLGLATLLALTSGGGLAARAGTPASISVFASGLESPRGLAFGPDGSLYVAEGGAGGTQSTVGQCEQVPFPVGPYRGGMTARISRIAPDGTRSTVVDGLPSSQTGPLTGNLVSGVADVAFLQGQLVGLEAGAGCSHGLTGTANTIFRVNRDGSTTTLADLSAFVAANPVANPDPVDFEPDGTWYSMLRWGNTLYVIEPNHQELDRINQDGSIVRVVDFSRTFPGLTDWRGPTAMTRHGNDFYIGTLTPFPQTPGAAQIWKVDRNGNFSVYASGFNAILGVAFEARGRLYVLESFVGPPFPTPGFGEIVRIDGNQRETIATGLNVPTGMAFGPDGNLYVSNNGYGAPAGAGQVLKISINS